MQWTASNPSAATGQTLAQAWSRSTSSDAPQPAREPHPSASVAGALEGATQLQRAQDQAPGVTNAQPSLARWPYDGVTLQLGPPP